MMTDSNSKIVINSLLCYVSSARDFLPNDQILQCGLVFYDSNVIKDSKDFLFDLIDEKPIRRRGENCKKAEFQDILDMFVKIEENDIPLPKFVCDSFKSMPPSSGYELVGSMLNSLFDEIALLREEIKVLNTKNSSDLKVSADTANIKSNVAEIKEDVKTLVFKSNSLNTPRIKSKSIDLSSSLNNNYVPSAPTLAKLMKIFPLLNLHPC